MQHPPLRFITPRKTEVENLTDDQKQKEKAPKKIYSALVASYTDKPFKPPVITLVLFARYYPNPLTAPFTWTKEKYATLELFGQPQKVDDNVCTYNSPRITFHRDDIEVLDLDSPVIIRFARVYLEDPLTVVYALGQSWSLYKCKVYQVPKGIVNKKVKLGRKRNPIPPAYRGRYLKDGAMRYVEQQLRHCI